ncbi:MAG: GntR family transcriptional regulator [Anaerovoracaceae bacterium]
MDKKTQNLKGVFTDKNATTASNLFHVLRMEIIQGKYRSGQKITEQQLCDEYNVSRTPAREVLFRLEMEGLVDVIPNRGAFIAEITERDIKDLFVLRSVYELQATKWAIERISDSEIDDLTENFEFMEFYSKKGDIDKMLNINTNFHSIIYSASGNRMISQLLSFCHIYLNNFSEAYADSISHETLMVILEEHRKIFEAIKSRNIELAIFATEAHLLNSKLRRNL